MYSNVHMTTPFNLLCILTISFTPHEPKLIQTSTENYTYILTYLHTYILIYLYTYILIYFDIQTYRVSAYPFVVGSHNGYISQENKDRLKKLHTKRT